MSSHPLLADKFLSRREGENDRDHLRSDGSWALPPKNLLFSIVQVGLSFSTAAETNMASFLASASAPL